MACILTVQRCKNFNFVVTSKYIVRFYNPGVFNLGHHFKKLSLGWREIQPNEAEPCNKINNWHLVNNFFLNVLISSGLSLLLSAEVKTYRVNYFHSCPMSIIRTLVKLFYKSLHKTLSS